MTSPSDTRSLDSLMLTEGLRFVQVTGVNEHCVTDHTGHGNLFEQPLGPTFAALNIRAEL